MTNRQGRKISMNSLVEGYMKKVSAGLRSRIPNLDFTCGEFRRVNKELDVQAKKQLEGRKEYQSIKAKIRQGMIGMSLDVSAKVIGYARDAGDMELYGAVNYRRRDLVLFSDLDCRGVCVIIYERAMGVADALVNYGLGVQQLDALGKLIEEFRVVMPLPKAGVGNRKDATSGIKVLLKETDLLLETLDMYMEMVRVDEPEIYKGYYYARKLRRPGFRKLSGQGWVKDSSGAAIGGVDMSCAALGLKKRLSKFGGFRLFHIKEGDYEFVFEKEGYESEVVLVRIRKGERAEVGVVMGEIILNDEIS